MFCFGMNARSETFVPLIYCDAVTDHVLLQATHQTQHRLLRRFSSSALWTFV